MVMKQRTWYTQPERLLMPFERRLEFLQARLKDHSPRYQWLQTSERLAQLKHLLRQRGNELIQRRTQKLDLIKQALTYQNPLTILSQGYALVEKDDRVLTSVDSARPGETLTIRLKDGRIHSRVETIDKKENDQ
jgi:exodeoxyribonuclease VII large subunit